MRCYCCNKQLTDKEVIYNPELGHDEPCTTCLDIAIDAAYSGGFITGDEDIYLPSFDDTDTFDDEGTMKGYGNDELL